MTEQSQAAVSDEPKHPGGRPTKYKPEFCDNVIEWGKQGKSKAWMCAEMGITPETMSVWEKEKPEFSEAITRAVIYSQQWWEDTGQKSLEKAGFQASMWSRSMAARFPADWREKSESTQTHNLGDGVLELLGAVSGKTRSL